METSKTSIKILLWILSITLIVLTGTIFLQDFIPRYLVFPSIFGGGILLLICGIWLIVLTVKRKVQGKLRKFLILAGVCAVGIIVSIILHNLIYALFIYLFGPNFWAKLGTNDEVIFFILGIVVCPIGLATGIIGSSVQLSKTPDNV
ncbi:MAG: hypothetical protein J7L03_01690 [Caldisericaceae bacterium]|nr:hypothetical protein [Caldisericaceae bacterium]